MTSRALLIQSSSSTITNYVMQTALFPVHTLELIEKVNLHFLLCFVSIHVKQVIYDSTFKMLKSFKDSIEIKANNYEKEDRNL